MGGALGCAGQKCSQPLDPDFYDGYTVRKIELRHPFNFMFLVHHQLQKLKGALPLAENEPFSRMKFKQSSDIVDLSVSADESFGFSLAKVVVVTGSITNCHEAAGEPKSVDIVYQIFSSDPLPAISAPAEDRIAATDEPATGAAEHNTRPAYKLRPLLGYEVSKRGFGGVALQFSLPGRAFDAGHLTAVGSPTSRQIEFQLGGSRVTRLDFMKQIDYRVAYNYTREPVSSATLNTSVFQAGFDASSATHDTGTGRWLIRYGALIQAGNQQAGMTSAPPGVVTNSSYSALRAYVGLSRSTRYSEGLASYGLQLSGTGIGNLNSAKHLVDFLYTRRFPGRTHSPWDIQLRSSAGLLKDGKLFSDRFFGGNSIRAFMPGNAWVIPNGPFIRSIPANRLNALGMGGTSFFSANFTAGKVLLFKPLIPREVESSNGFGTSIDAGENTAEGFFFDSYLAETPEYNSLIALHAARLKSDFDDLQSLLTSIASGPSLSSKTTKILTSAQSLLRAAQRIVRHATVPDDQGKTNPQGLVTLLNVNTSPLLKGGAQPGVRDLLTQLASLLSANTSGPVIASRDKMVEDLNSFRAATDAIKTSPAGQQSAAQARKDMTRPREVIDALRHEINSYSFSVVGMFDVARMWPDRPDRYWYGVGPGGRFSLLNINFTLGYAVNSEPARTAGLGRGAFVFSLTYTDWFR